MKTARKFLSVRDLIDLSKNGMAQANSEYQRGEAWSPSQRKKLIEVMPNISYRPFISISKKTEAAGLIAILDIIDGQQRNDRPFTVLSGRGLPSV